VQQQGAWAFEKVSSIFFKNKSLACIMRDTANTKLFQNAMPPFCRHWSKGFLL
jgi:hypothetical protein